MSPTNLAVLSVALFVVGAACSAVLVRDRIRCGYLAFAFTLAAAVAAGAAGVRVFVSGPTDAAVLARIGDLGASLTVHVDYLSALFLIVVAFIATVTTLFSIRYLEAHPQESALRYYPILLLFFGGIVGVICTWDMLFFLVFWEFMTLASYFLVVYYRSDAVALRAGLKYFIVTHVATACLIAAAVILYVHGGHSFSFEAMRVGVTNLAVHAPGLLHVVLGLFFVGFATKAGIFPFGDWLPDAYPAAPAPATAAFAGTMTKLGIYGLIRVFFQFLPVYDTCLVWGGILAIFGAVSIAMGTLTALLQDDSKRLLSFSVVGQMGYILLGVGLGVYFRPLVPALAALAAVGGLFHMVNDTCYKSCLFLSAGAVEYRTGTRDLNLIGGLAGVMPLTAVAAIVASLAISGIPPFSGFSSKWLLYHAAFMGGKIAPFTLVLGLIAMFVAIATLALFLKFVTVTFFGKLRTPDPEREVREVPLSMVLPQMALAAVCVLFGVAPMLAVKPVYAGIAGLLTSGELPAFAAVFGSGSAGLALNTGVGLQGAWIPWPILIALAATAALAYVIYRAGSAEVLVSPVWYCGEEHTDEETAYLAHSLYRPFKDMLRVRIGPYETAGIYPRLPRLRAPGFAWLRRLFDFDQWAYYPFIRWGARMVGRFSETHAGIAQLYLLWMVIGTVAAVAVLLWLGGH